MSRHISYVCPNCHWSMDRHADTDIYDVWVEQKPAHASDILQEPVDETAKREHEVEFREYLTRLNWQQGYERGWDDAVEKLTLTQEKLGYTAPPKREWVGLTEEEREQVRSSAGYNQFMSAGEYAKAVQLTTEAKLKERNA